MKILNRVQLTANEKKNILGSSKKDSLSNIDKQIQEKNDVLIDLVEKLKGLSTTLVERESKYAKLTLSIASFDFPKHKKEYNDLLNKISTSKAKLEDTQRQLNTLETNKKELVKTFNKMMVSKNTVSNQLIQDESALKKIKGKIKLSGGELVTVTAKNTKKIKEQEKELTNSVKKAQEILKIASEDGLSIVDKAELESQEIALRIVKQGELLNVENTELEKQNVILKEENEELTKLNKKESKEAGKKIKKAEELAEEVKKEKDEIELIKKRVLSEIYRIAKQNKVDKIDGEIKKLL